MGILVVLLILAGVAYYFMRPEERSKVGQTLLAWLRLAKEAVLRRWRAEEAPDGEPLPSLPLATSALILVNIFVFLDMLIGEGALREEATLISWGANFGPRTTNGEWWRLISSLFVHVGYLHLVADVCALLLLGVIAERVLGSVALTTVYFVAGILTSLVSVSGAPVAPNVGASGAVSGICGLLVATWLWSVVQRSPIDIPLRALKVIVPAIVLLLLYSATTQRLGTRVDLAGFMMGFVCGIVLAFGSDERKPAVRRVAAVAAATVVLAVAFAVPLRGLSDVRPEIARIIALEDRVAGEYRTAVKRLTEGHIQPRALGDFIERTIAPQFQECRARLKAYEHVPPEHQPLVTAADEYLRLRSDSWRVRSDALRASNMKALQAADRIEWQSHDAFEALKQIAAK